jgi:uncharacterized membrane protein
MTIHRAERSIHVAAPAAACFATAVDYGTFPEWQSAVIAVEVLERNADGLGELVEFRTDARLREVTYRLRYHYGDDHRVWWDFVEGDGVEHIEGEYTFEPNGGGARVTYRLGIDPGIPAPGFVVRKLNQQVMQRSVEDLKREIERRSA